jgi:hypothetical protein
VNDWQPFFLGVMAVALVAMAAAQVFIGVALLRASRQMTDLAGQMRNDIRPLLEKAIRLTDEASRVTSMAVVQMERVDKLTLLLVTRVDETMGVLQSAVVGPVRQGAALLAGLKAVVGAVREWQNRPSRPHEDEDPLFVG